MPELPEVETTRAGIDPHLRGRRLLGWEVRNPALRWPVRLPEDVAGQTVVTIGRRGKYLLLHTERGAFIIHLGMSGRLHILPEDTPPHTHDHVDFHFDSGQVLRLNDPRRFGSIHWHEGDPATHWLLARLGPEPLSDAFHGAYLKQCARNRRVAIKELLMNSQVVVGVGNIYANESLFLAGIRPGIACGRLSRPALDNLCGAVKAVLARALAAGGTTLRDFLDPAGNPGYFVQALNVYGRAGKPCPTCGSTLIGTRRGNRATVFCRNCQTARGNRDYCC